MDDLIHEFANLYQRAPSKMEKSQIMRRIHEEASEIARLDRFIDEAQDLVRLLLQKQRSLRVDRMMAYRSFFTPIYRLPKEILAEIFTLSVFFSRKYGETRAERNAAPAVLAQVSRRWRDLAVALPCLWTLVDFDCSSRTSVKAAIVRLKRADQRFPIELHVSGAPTGGNSVELQVKVIHRFARIIGDLRLNLANIKLYDNLFPPPRTAIVAFEGDDGELKEKVTSATSCPLLRKLWIGEASEHIFDVELDPRRLNAPWEQLTSLHIDQSLSLLPASEVLSRCTSLLECQLTITALDPDEEEDHSSRLPIKELPHLHTLSITIAGQRSQSYAHFFDALTLPALKHLSLFPQDNELDMEAGAFLRLKARSDLDLESFTVEDSYFMSHAVITFLMDMDSLRSIRLVACEDVIDANFFDALTYRQQDVDDGEQLAPDLEEFSFSQTQCYFTEQQDYETIIAMMESRCPPLEGEDEDFWYDANGVARGPVYLESVNLSFGGNAPPAVWTENEDIKRRVDECRKRAMDVEFD